MAVLHCPARPCGHRHYSNSLSGCHTGRALCSCPLACVSWLEQGDHLGALLLVTVGCSFHRPNFNDSLHRPSSVHLYMYTEVSISQRSETTSKTPADFHQKLKLHLITYILEETG